MAMKALVFILETNPVFEGADQMTEMKATRRPHAAQNSWFTHTDLRCQQHAPEKAMGGPNRYGGTPETSSRMKIMNE